MTESLGVGRLRRPKETPGNKGAAPPELAGDLLEVGPSKTSPATDPKTPKTPAAAGSVEMTEGALMLKYLRVFREIDVSGDGRISAAELKSALEQSGLTLSTREYRKFITAMDLDHDGFLEFEEFCELAKTLSSSVIKYRSKAVMRLPRLYLTVEQYDSYSKLFRERAGQDGQLDAEELSSFLADLKMGPVSADKLKAIMAEVDDDQSGFLDEQEFMVLLIKCTGLKKRKAGPGQCPLATLKAEGWPHTDLKRLGYECKDFMEAGYNVHDLMESFPASELRRIGVTLADLLKAGWDCNKAREAGFAVEDVMQSGVSRTRIKNAGWEELPPASTLRRISIDAGLLRLGGWSLSELRRAGFSTSELRLAGFSNAALAALQQVLAKEAEAQAGSPSERRSVLAETGGALQGEAPSRQVS